MLLICNILLLFFWLIFKKSKIWLAVFTIFIGYGAIQRTLGFNKQNESSEGIEVVSYNIGHSRYLFKSKEGEEIINGFTNFIQKDLPDVVCLQERAKVDIPIYNEIFNGYDIHPNKFIGTCIYSKWPFVNKGNLAFDTQAHNATWADINIEGEVIRVYSIHLSSNKVTNLTDNIKEIWDESIYILDKYNVHAIKRIEQLQKILDHAEKSPYPVLITGDFNDMPQSYIYNMIDKKYTDAFVEHGIFFGKTHNTRLPGLRIDYAFASEDLEIHNYKVLDQEYSDHYPISIRISSK